MKKIKKYATDADLDSGSLKLDAYLQQTQNFLSRDHRLECSSKKNIPLAGIVPLVAASLVPMAMNAQCNQAVFTPSNTATANVAGNGTDMTIDVDGDGTIDFELDIALGTAGGGSPNLGDLFLHPENGAEVLCYAAGGGYFYVNKYNTNNAITSAGTVWKSGPSLPGGQCTMDYQTSGQWHGTGPVTGYVGFRIDGNRLGFMEVVYETGVQVSVTVALTGTQDDEAQPLTSINAGNCPGLLPVELSKFTAATKGDQVKLEWTTQTEINNEGFEIQRSMNGRDFAKLDWVKGQGNASSAIDYNYTDKVSLNTQYYYRLKQIDYDGRYSFSDVRTVISKDDQGVILHDISPNPISGALARVKVSANADEQLSFNVFDALGQLVVEQTISVTGGTNTYNLDVESLANGSYFVKLSGSNHASYKKIVIAK